MNCEDLLVLLESDDPADRSRAADHAAGCAECAAVAERWNLLRSELVTPAVLTGSDRTAWMAAADDQVSTRDDTDRTRSPERRNGFAVLAVAVLSVLVAVLAWETVRRSGDDAGDIADNHDPGSFVGTEVDDDNEPRTTVTALDAAPELDRLLDEITLLRREIEDARGATLRASALREFDVQLAEYRWPSDEGP